MCESVLHCQFKYFTDHFSMRYIRVEQNKHMGWRGVRNFEKKFACKFLNIWQFNEVRKYIWIPELFIALLESMYVFFFKFSALSPWKCKNEPIFWVPVFENTLFIDGIWRVAFQNVIHTVRRMYLNYGTAWLIYLSKKFSKGNYFD